MRLRDQLPALTAAIAPLDTPERRARYAARDIPRGHLVQDIDKRYRFDLFYAARAYSLLPDDVTDAHIDTALRKIVPSLKEEK